MKLRDIIGALMLSEFYFSLPLWERKRVVLRLWALYGGPEVANASEWPPTLLPQGQSTGSHWPPT